MRVSVWGVRTGGPRWAPASRFPAPHTCRWERRPDWTHPRFPPTNRRLEREVWSTAGGGHTNYKCTCFLYGAGHMDLDGGEIHNEGRLKGGPWNGNESSKCHLGPKNSRFQGPPLQTVREIDFPHPNPYVQPHIKTGTLVILWTRDFTAHSEMVSNKFDYMPLP
jgi:hypothetical protein